MQNRFVVLEHTPGDQLGRSGDVHFDWMFESDGVLRTWATEPIVRFDQSICIVAEKLPDHRIEYLDFEGDIGRGRGAVSRRCEGSYRLLDHDNLDHNDLDHDNLDHDENVFVAELTWHDKRPPRGLAANKNRLEIRPGILRLF
ncbi:ATP-dependent DNA ligase [Novipirellula aureliae]|uniref:ATP-dependent DNA ligase n=1 Tax=Novipirellula aureliae TaxID=2527966 RepID=A0A5C6E244_9BACT|nr:DNA polymerase ligase N-terminal domain-containing protein [Novipirellula aureliae]TWU42992.1 ATP-dependent DNA ligase [Novipirellula aureliae]